MGKDSMKAVVFDADGVLVKGYSWTAVTESVGSSVEDHLAIYEKRKSGELNEPDAKAEILRLWRKNGPINKAHFLSLYNSMPLMPGAEDVVTYLKKKGYLLCIITGSSDLYAEVVARRLGIPYYFSNTKFFWDDKDSLFDYAYDVRQSRTKLYQFNFFAEINGIDPKTCAMIGDSLNDIELFKLSGKGIAVRPPKDSATGFEKFEELEKVAWKVIDDLSEIKEFL